MAVVQRLAVTFGQTAEHLASSSAQLRRLADLQGWTGDSAEAFAGAADDLQDDLGMYVQRHHNAGQALTGFVEPLAHARAESAAALQEGVVAYDETQALRGNALTGVVAPTAAQVAAQQAQDRAREQALGRLEAAKARLQRALDALDDAARATAGKIHHAAEHGKDKFWDNVKGGLRDFAGAVHLTTIVKIAGWVAAAVAVVAIVVALIATSPAWLVTGLVLAGMILGGAMLAGDTIMAADGSGEAGLIDVGLDLFGLITLGYGRTLRAGARADVFAAREKAATIRAAAARTAEWDRLAATPNGVRAASGMHIADPANNLRIWAQRLQATHAAQASRAGTGAGAALRAQHAAVPSLLRSMPYMDRELAQTAAEIKRLRALPEAVKPVVARSLREAARQLRGAQALSHLGNAGWVVSTERWVSASEPEALPTNPLGAVGWQLTP